MRAKLAILAGLTAVVLTGCTTIPGYRGYIRDELLVNSVQPGIDNRESVERTLGRPSFVSQFGNQTWYYISSRTEQAPFGSPQIDDHNVLAVSFDASGNVSTAERSGMERVVRINPESDETPTLGRERGFLEDLFGNIGQVGGVGPTGGGGGGSR